MTRMPVILGPTASGKTSLAVQIAISLNGEIVSADSRQVYRNLDIGTGKDLDEYEVDGRQIPYHLIDICDVGEEYEIARYFRDYCGAVNDILSRSATPILCGGSGLYLQTALQGNSLAQIPVDEELRKSLAACSEHELQAMWALSGEEKTPDTRKRLIRALEIQQYLKNNDAPEIILPEVDPVIFGIDVDRDERRKRISNRLRKRIHEGMIAEVEAILEHGAKADDLKRLGLEFLFITEHLEGKYNLEEMTLRLESSIHRFAKRQMTFFRKMERDGWHIRWVKYDARSEEVPIEVREYLSL